MTPRDKIRAKVLSQKIRQFESENGALPGIIGPAHLETLVTQFIDSLRRIEFAHYIRDTPLSPDHADPNSGRFDPLKAAVLHNRQGNIAEAWWLVFIATHFGKHVLDGWRLTRDVYGKLGQGGLWDWPNISGNPAGFRNWLAANEPVLLGGDGISRRFSNHRKYESIKASSEKGTAAIFASYVAWIAASGSTLDLIRELHKRVGQNPHEVFAALYDSMDVVQRFGRLGKFDFLAMLGKLGIAPIDPGSTFLKGATGPLAGARLLYGGKPTANMSAQELEEKLAYFGEKIDLAIKFWKMLCAIGKKVLTISYALRGKAVRWDLVPNITALQSIEAIRLHTVKVLQLSYNKSGRNTHSACESLDRGYIRSKGSELKNMVRRHDHSFRKSVSFFFLVDGCIALIF